MTNPTTNPDLIHQEQSATEYADKLVKSHSVKPTEEEQSLGTQVF